MTQFSKQRAAGLTLFLLSSVLVVSLHAEYADAVPRLAYLSGWLLFAVMLILTFYNARKKLSFLPLLTSEGWLQFHIYAALFTAVLFCVHISYKIPNGWFECTLAGLYSLVMLSGFFGLFASRGIPKRLTTRGGEVLFERIPGIRRQLQERAEMLALKSVEEVKSSTIADFYARELKVFFDGAHNMVPHWFEIRTPLNLMLNKIADLNRYLNGSERATMDEIATLVRQKDGLDYHYSLQLVLKLWLFVHIPLTYSLLLWTLAHVVLVFAALGRRAMKEQLPAPDFNRHQYERPNQNWICGHAAEGKPCRIGPDGQGHCRATYECQPALETKPGEAKGRYKCTRPAEYGGQCASGPLPDGTCCRCIAKCVPVRSLRAKRKLLSICVTALTAAVLLIGLCGPFRSKFINPGKLSSQHATATFAKMAGAQRSDEETCIACHRSAHAGPHGLVKAAFNAKPGPFQLHSLAALGPPGMNEIDRNCEQCHLAHSFHEPNVVSAHSCSACHREHQGSGLMPRPTDANCLVCHANAQVMQASQERAKNLSPAAFDFRPAQGRVVFKTQRPERGYTELIHSFATDHPEFQVLADKLKDPDKLKFNHALHLTSPNLPPVNGHKLECADCHKPDAAGVYYLKISYAENCQSCHSLQFDVDNPELRVPHGNAEHVRAFLRSLGEQYSEFGAKKGIAPANLPNYVQSQMAQIRQRYGSGEELERRIFFSDANSGPVTQVAGAGAQGAASFPGCAYCHEVTASQNNAPLLTQPVIPDRWLIRGQFDHSKHFKIACTQCHDALHSHDTTDILLPTKASCVECHSPKGGVVSTCSTCHSFHTPQKSAERLARD